MKKSPKQTKRSFSSPSKAINKQPSKIKVLTQTRTDIHNVIQNKQPPNLRQQLQG